MEEGEGERRQKIARWKMEEVKTTPNDQSNINFLNKLLLSSIFYQKSFYRRD